MNRLSQSLLIIATGFLTSFFVAILHNMTGMHLFTWMFWFVIPIGSIGIGFIAASGYYISAILLHHRPLKTLLLGMLAVAVGTQLFIYYLEYSSMILDDGTSLSDIVGFGEYINISLTNQSYQTFVRSVSVGTSDALGSWGYGIALLQFTGLMVGALTYYLILISKPYCKKCGKYYKSKGIIDKLFRNGDEYDAYISLLYENSAFSKDFVNLLIARQEPVETIMGMVQSTFTIFECVGCHQELLIRKVYVNDGEWKEIDSLSHKEPVPEGVSIKQHFKT